MFFLHKTVGILLLGISIALSPVANAAGENAEQAKAQERADHLLKALQNTNFSEADKITANIARDSKIRNWSYYPFSEFIEEFTPGISEKYFEELNNWVLANNNSAMAHLFRAEYYYKNAWHYRGNGYAGTVTSARMQKYEDDIHAAQADITSALRLDDSVPHTQYLALEIAQEHSSARETEAVFQQGIAKFPGYYPLYSARLFHLAPKWGGTVGQMIIFTFKYTDRLPKDSPLKILPLDLYKYLVMDMGTNCGESESVRKAQCVKAVSDLLQGDIMEKKMRDAFALYTDVDHLDFNKKVVNTILNSNSLFDSPFHKIFDLATEALGEDNYALNIVYGNMYTRKDQYEKALAYYDRAMKDMETFQFTSNDDRRDRITWLYNRESEVSGWAHQDVNALSYSEKSVALDDKRAWSFELRCAANLRVKEYQKAVDDCTTAIKLNGDNSFVRYVRAISYYNLHQFPDEEVDLEIARKMRDGKAEQHLVLEALIGAYGNDGKYQKVIDTYDEYPELLSKENPGRSGYYAVRCGAYMHLKEYAKALDDCNQSLATGFDPRALDYKNQILEHTSH